MHSLPVPVAPRDYSRTAKVTACVIHVIDINQVIHSHVDRVSAMLESGHPKMVQYAPPVMPEDPGNADLQLAGNRSLICHES